VQPTTTKATQVAITATFEAPSPPSQASHFHMDPFRAPSRGLGSVHAFTEDPSRLADTRRRTHEHHSQYFSREVLSCSWTWPAVYASGEVRTRKHEETLQRFIDLMLACFGDVVADVTVTA